MKKPFILLTGDDSVRAEGLILIKRIVEKFANFQIIATKKQHSACGAMLNIMGGEWGKEIVDGVEAIWIDGSPADSVFFAFDYLKERPDLVISGMNFGENNSNGMYSSGTIGAALAAANSRHTGSIAFSMVSTCDHWLRTHDGSINEQFLVYPGKVIEKLIKLALKIGMPERTFWNVNFPPEETDKIRVVKTAEDGYWPNTQEIDKHRFIYKPVKNTENWPENTDSGALVDGFISLTPCRVDFTNGSEYKRLRNLKVFKL